MKLGGAICSFFLMMHCCALGAAHEGTVCLDFGVSGRKGRRQEFQDAYAIQSSKGQILFSLFDGHAGDEAAFFAAQSLPECIIKNGERDAFSTVQKKLRSVDCASGTTALTVRVMCKDAGRKQLEIAWVGDSRAILIDKNGQMLVQTSDHKPEQRSEKKRVVQAGAVLYCQSRRRKNGQVKSITRVAQTLPHLSRAQSCPDLRYLAKLSLHGGLSLSRALGDADWPEEIISPVPEIITYPLRAGFEGYIILATDGVWDTVSNSAAAKYVLQAQGLFEQLDDADILELSDDSAACQRDGASTHEAGSSDRAILMARGLRDLAYYYGSSDNITALVISLQCKKNADEGV